MVGSNFPAQEAGFMNQKNTAEFEALATDDRVAMVREVEAKIKNPLKGNHE
jgi:hypothetical protein